MLGKVRCVLLSQILKRNCGKKLNKPQRGGRNGSVCAWCSRGYGHRWGGSSSHRDGAAGRGTDLLPLPILLHKASLPGAWLWSRWPWKPFRMAADRNPTPSLGLPAGCWGYGGGCGREARRPAEAPGQQGLPSPSAHLDPTEEKPQSSRMILSVNKVSLDLGFKMAQLLSRVLIRKC